VAAALLPPPGGEGVPEAELAVSGRRRRRDDAEDDRIKESLPYSSGHYRCRAADHDVQRLNCPYDARVWRYISDQSAGIGISAGAGSLVQLWKQVPYWSFGIEFMCDGEALERYAQLRNAL
jgi:hypothetical protein